ncbi:MAG: hypothetical protein LBW85_07870 [Deltaproteobacteria bacterium]|jgi:phage gpG-like protein|nr:hypothetical protein [Deltaproteobacteria bacterium]
MPWIDVQLHTNAPQKIAQIVKKLQAGQLADAKLHVANELRNLTVERFAAQSDPWGDPWIPSKRVMGNAEALAGFRKAEMRYARALAAWQEGGGKGRKPKKPKPPRDERNRKLTTPGQTLVQTGRLKSSFEVVKRGQEVVLTVAKGKGGGTAAQKFKAAGSISALVYFPTHQFGRGGIPARPMLPIRGGGIDLSASYGDRIKDVLDSWVKDVLSG